MFSSTTLQPHRLVSGGGAVYRSGRRRRAASAAWAEMVGLVHAHGSPPSLATHTQVLHRAPPRPAVPPAERQIEGLLTYVYHLFPNVVVTVLSRHTNLIVLEPLAPDRTRLVRYVLTNDSGEEALREARRDQGFVGGTGTAEDREVVTAIQRSIGSGANDAFTFGEFESAIIHFHRTLTALVDA